jgi:hypothetical protein
MVGGSFEGPALCGKLMPGNDGEAHHLKALISTLV